MQMMLVVAGLAGFGLGLRIGLFGLMSVTALGATLLVVLALASVTEIGIWQSVAAIAVFQLAAFGAMVARHTGPAPEPIALRADRGHFGLRSARSRSAR